MATMPVVWCTDPNSVNNKPAAFALHGIQLQGNVTEKQVLALRELVNAAAEGRLILPSDGTFMLLDSGISIESSIVNNGENATKGATASNVTAPTEFVAASCDKRSNTFDFDKENVGQNVETKLSDNNRPLKNTYILMPVTTSVHVNTSLKMQQHVPASSESGQQQEFELEPKYSTFTPPPSTSEDEVLYDFLCCAKCMNDPNGSRCSNSTSKRALLSSSLSRQRKTQSQAMLQRLLKSCERPSCLSRGGEQQRQKQQMQDCPLNNDPSGHNCGKVNEPHQLCDPTYSIANKYTRRYQRKHCNMSAATIARNRHHNHRHKLPMQSVKIFHNRSHACSNGGGGGGNSVASGGGLAKSTTVSVVGCSKTAKGMPIPLVLDQPSSLKPVLQLPLYATVNKRNGKSIMTMELNSSEQTDSVELVAVNDVVHESPRLGKFRKHDSVLPKVSATGRQRKMGAVQGSLQDTVLIEMENFSPNSTKLPTPNCDIVMDTLPIVKDLISFEDVDNVDVVIDASVDAKACNDNRQPEQPKSCDRNSHIVDLLSEPNIDFDPSTLEEHASSREEPITEVIGASASPPPVRSNASSRKTSFDSTCTISSMDSGFIEMQNKLENQPSHPPLASIFAGMAHNSGVLGTLREDSRRQGSGGGGEKIARLNYKECLTQSRNRRKSYEEFKAMFANLDASPSASASATSPQLTDCSFTGADTNKIQIRRKTYQDLRKLFENDIDSEALHSVLATVTASAGPTEITTTNTLESISEQECAKAAPSPTTTPTTSTTLDATEVEETLVDLSGGDDGCRASTKPALTNEFAKATSTSTTTTTVPGTHEMDTAAHDSDDSNANAHCLALSTGECTTTLTASDTIAIATATASSIEDSQQTTDILRKNSDFLSKILDRQLMAKEKEKAHMRRKSYEEFKRLVRECESTNTNDKQITDSASSPLKRQNSKHRKSYASFLLMRRNSQSKESKKTVNGSGLGSMPDGKDSLKLQPSNQMPETTSTSSQISSNNPTSSTGSSSYRHNFKIYDKLVYGTIYDIIQRKNDIYNLTYQRYDKYMTYGTIYEILHRKTSQTSISSNSSTTTSADKAFHRKSLAAILEKDTCTPSNVDKNKRKDLENLKKAGMIYDIIQKQQLSNTAVKDVCCQKGDDAVTDQASKQAPTTAVTSANSDGNGNINANADQEKENATRCAPRATTTNATYKYGTIYDILQGEKLDANNETTAITMAMATASAAVNGVKQLKGHVKNRFVVSKIDESLKTPATTVGETSTENTRIDNKEKREEGVSATVIDSKNVLKTTKPNKIRRLSHMLTHKSAFHDAKTHSSDSNNGDLLAENVKGECPAIKSNLIPLDSEELYSRIIAKNRAKAGGGPIQKSNSLDAISISVTVSPPASPSPPRPRRSLKQHNCLRDAQKPKQLALVKKLSLDNSFTSDPHHSRLPKDNDNKLRRWSNQIPLKCHCDHAFTNGDVLCASRDLSISWEFALPPKSNCTCNEPFSHSVNSAKTQSYTGHNMHGGVINVSATELSSFTTNTAACSTSTRNTCPIHTELPCLCLPSKNTTNSSTPAVVSNASKTSIATTTTNSIATAASSAVSSKKGKSRRLSEFTRGEFLNEKP